MVQHRYWSSSCGGEENGRFLGMIIGSNELFFLFFNFSFKVKQLKLWWDESWGINGFQLSSAIVDNGEMKWKELYERNGMNRMIWEEWYERNDMNGMIWKVVQCQYTNLYDKRLS